MCTRILRTPFWSKWEHYAIDKFTGTGKWNRTGLLFPFFVKLATETIQY
jgi:hypothetical protein